MALGVNGSKTEVARAKPPYIVKHFVLVLDKRQIVCGYDRQWFDKPP
jgi:hypothetical protein